MTNKKQKEDVWWVNVIMGFVCVALTIYFTNADNYSKHLKVGNSDISGGKGERLFVYLFKLLDSYGGQKLVIIVLSLMTIMCFWWAYRKYRKDKKNEIYMKNKY